MREQTAELINMVERAMMDKGFLVTLDHFRSPRTVNDMLMIIDPVAWLDIANKTLEIAGFPFYVGDFFVRSRIVGFHEGNLGGYPWVAKKMYYATRLGVLAGKIFAFFFYSTDVICSVRDSRFYVVYIDKGHEVISRKLTEALAMRISAEAGL